jgi:hypothetical protein
MTEAEWLTATDPTPMLEFLKGKASDRKLRLFGCACCRRVWKWMIHKGSREGVRAAERLADVVASADEWERARKGTAEAWNQYGEWHVYQSSRSAHYLLSNKTEVLMAVAQEVANAKWNHTKDKYSCDGDSERAKATLSREKAYQHPRLRDIFGNPFRPAVVDPAWLTSTVAALATQMYESRDFSTMPILADALQDAGCDSDDILDHCRGPGPHVRGCWVVDLVLGKT